MRRAGVRDAVEVRAGAASAASLPQFAAGETVVVLGLCGALRELPAGYVVLYTRIVDGAHAFEIDPNVVATIRRAVPHARAVTASTADQVLTGVAERAALAQRSGADVVDMEGTHLAVALAARGVRFAMVRVVSDDASRDLPALADAVGPDGRIRPLRVAFAFARAPRAALRFVVDVRLALVALREVARAVASIPDDGRAKRRMRVL